MSHEQASAPNPEHILQTGLAFWASKTLLSAVELRLFTVLAREPLGHEALAARLGLHPRAARDFFDALVATGFLLCTDGRYHNTPATDLFLDADKPSYIGGILEMANLRLYKFWGGLTDALRSGQPQNEAAHGGPSPFDSIYGDRDRLEVFLKGMTGVSRTANQVIAQRFPWDRYQTFVDVGCAQGDLAVQVATRHPHLRGRGFDLPAVQPIFEAHAAQAGLASRLSFAPGSFFTEPLPRADVIMMGHILHDWDLAQKKMLIRKAWEALPPGGAFIVYEAIIDDERRRNAFGLLMSLNMLIETPGGFDYTGADCRGWMAEAGFRETYVEHLVGPDSMVVGIK